MEGVTGAFEFNECWEPEPMSGCWLWTKGLSSGNYGIFRQKPAHRASYELHVAPIPDGFVIDHLCRNHACVNPDHLRACTQRENVLASGSLANAKANADRTHCIKGHEFTPENTRTYKNKGGNRVRQCITCKIEYDKKRNLETYTHCPRGHKLSGDNVWFYKDGRRKCAICSPPKSTK